MHHGDGIIKWLLLGLESMVAPAAWVPWASIERAEPVPFRQADSDPSLAEPLKLSHDGHHLHVLVCCPFPGSPRYSENYLQQCVLPRTGATCLLSLVCSFPLRASVSHCDWRGQFLGVLPTLNHLHLMAKVRVHNGYS